MVYGEIDFLENVMEDGKLKLKSLFYIYEVLSKY